jgi:hypothetical protein
LRIHLITDTGLAQPGSLTPSCADLTDFEWRSQRCRSTGRVGGHGEADRDSRRSRRGDDVVTGGLCLSQSALHDEFSERVRNFCDVSGLTVRQDVILDVRYSLKTHGRDQLAYFQSHGRVRVVYTNVRTSEYVTEVTRVMEKDLRVTDNGDGTLTILVFPTASSSVYDATGKAIARNPGQFRYEILVDHGGTPSDPSDDKFLEFLGVVKESNGRTDHFCAAVVPAIS